MVAQPTGITMRSVQFHYLRVGHCRQLEAVAMSGGRLAHVEFPSFCAVIVHPAEGVWLFDTGYSDHYFDATRTLPEKLYRLALPVGLPDDERLSVQLSGLGFAPSDIRGVIVSHYHGDHVAGLRDFPKARFFRQPPWKHEAAPSGSTSHCSNIAWTSARHAARRFLAEAV
jgi:glyoxylase-like metal-dependent hydrolase (beta-lactamase superfamily II)